MPDILIWILLIMFSIVVLAVVIGGFIAARVARKAIDRKVREIMTDPDDWGAV